MPEWISVKDRLPEGWVLSFCRGKAVDVLKYDSQMQCWDSQYPKHCYRSGYVTHWMPLPEPPKEDE